MPVISTYSLSVVESETTSCLFKLQDTVSGNNSAHRGFVVLIDAIVCGILAYRIFPPPPKPGATRRQDFITVVVTQATCTARGISFSRTLHGCRNCIGRASRYVVQL